MTPTHAHAPRRLTEKALLSLGAPHLAYVRPVTTEDGATVFAIFGADGSHLGQAADAATALAAAKQHDFEPVLVS